VKKIIIILLLLISHFSFLTSFSQTIDSAEYFFDSDPGAGNGFSATINAGDSTLDSVYLNLTGLNKGFHTVFFRVKDTNNVWSLYEGNKFFIYDTTVASVASFDSSSGEYFFDTDPGIDSAASLTFSPGDSITDTLIIPTTGLASGFHNYFFRVKDTNNVWSLYEGSKFFLYDTSAVTTASFDSSAGEYFFDTDPGIDSAASLTFSPGDSIADTLIIPTTGLTTGFHNYFFRVQDSNNVWSLYEGAKFYLTDTITQTTPSSFPIASAEYFYDTDPGIGNGIAIANFSAADSILVTDTLPTSPLLAGTHYLFLRVRDTMNVWSLYDWQSFVVCNFIPVPDFTADTVCLNSPTTFTDLTTNLDTSANYTYDWDFNNDGFTDDTTRGNTTYTFPTSGTQTVSLIVNNTNGCADTVVKTVYVDSLPTVTLNFLTDTFCHDDTVFLSGGNPAGGIYSGNGVYNGIFFADSVSTGIHYISYTYYNSDSCSSIAYDAVYVTSCSGVNDFHTSGFRFQVNPNPFRESAMLQIEGSRDVREISVKIIDVFGKEVFQSSIINNYLLIHRGNLATGVYFLQLSEERKLLATGKLIVTD